MKIIFFGTPEFAQYALAQIVESRVCTVSAVVTMPDKRAGRGHKMIQSPVKEYAVAHDLPVLQPEKLKDEAFLKELKSHDADLFVVIAFRMLPEAVWAMPRYGTFNLHAALLPRYRGAAPINWAVINGDTETGVTTFFIDHNIDTGEIIAQEHIKIADTDNAGSVHDKLMEIGAKLTIKTIREIAERGNVETRPQPGGEFLPAPKIFTDTCRIDWRRPAKEIHNLVRGLSPYPGAWTSLKNGDTAKIFETRLVDSPEGISVRCGDGKLLQVLELQPQGRRRMTANEYLAGAEVIADNAITETIEEIEKNQDQMPCPHVHWTIEWTIWMPEFEISAPTPLDAVAVESTKTSIPPVPCSIDSDFMVTLRPLTMLKVANTEVKTFIQGSEKAQN